LTKNYINKKKDNLYIVLSRLQYPRCILRTILFTTFQMTQLYSYYALQYNQNPHLCSYYIYLFSFKTKIQRLSDIWKCNESHWNAKHRRIPMRTLNYVTRILIIFLPQFDLKPKRKSGLRFHLFISTLLKIPRMSVTPRII